MPQPFYIGKRTQLPIYAPRTSVHCVAIPAIIHSSVSTGSAQSAIDPTPTTSLSTVQQDQRIRQIAPLKKILKKPTKQRLYPFLTSKPHKKVRFALPARPPTQRARRSVPLPLLPRHPNCLTHLNIEHACKLGTIAYRRFLIQQLVVHLRGASFECSLGQLPEFRDPTGTLCWTLKTPRNQESNKNKWLTEDWFQVKVVIHRLKIDFFHIVSPYRVQFLISLPK